MPPRPDGTFTVPGSAAARGVGRGDGQGDRQGDRQGDWQGTGTPASASLPSLAEFLALDDAARAAVRGVRLAPDDELAPLLGGLDGLDVVAVEFPVFTDGRGFSHARRLRAVHGWRGELRATGDVRLDQARQMLRCGFDALEFREAPDEAVLLASLTRFPAPPYQPSYPVPSVAGGSR